MSVTGRPAGQCHHAHDKLTPMRSTSSGDERNLNRRAQKKQRNQESWTLFSLLPPVQYLPSHPWDRGRLFWPWKAQKTRKGIMHLFAQCNRMIRALGAGFLTSPNNRAKRCSSIVSPLLWSSHCRSGVAALLDSACFILCADDADTMRQQAAVAGDDADGAAVLHGCLYRSTRNANLIRTSKTGRC